MRIRKVTANFSFVAVVLALTLGLALSARSQTVLIKMGDNQTLNGTNAPSPDVNGHSWNSVDSTQFFPALTNLDGTVGGWAVAFGFEAGAVGDTDANNGPAGAVPPGTPANCVIDANALGNLGIKQSVYNYYVNSEFELQNLYPSRTYTLTFFGSHSQSPSDYTVYSIFTNSAYSTLEAAVAQFVQYPANPSVPNSNMVVSATVLPPKNGTLYVQFLGTNTVNGGVGTNKAGGYLNCMQLTQGPSTNATPPATDVNKTTLIQFVNSGTNVNHLGFPTPNPDVQGHYWNSVTPANFFPMTNAVNRINSIAYTANSLGACFSGFDSFNGPSSGTNGVTVTNNISDIATNALGYLGVATAVSDYFVTFQLEFDNLDPTHQYALNFFGSIKFPASEQTTYFVQNSGGSTLATTTLKVGTGQFNNEDRLATVSGVTGPADSTLFVIFEGTNSVGVCSNGPPQFAGYLNAMSLIDLTPYPAATAPPVNNTWLVNFGDTTTERGFANPSPDTQGHYWNSVGTNYYVNPVPLTNAAGTVSAMTFKFDTSNIAYTNANTPTRFGADSYNGPAAVPPGIGTVSSPTNAIINASALGYLGIPSAVCNYFVNSHFILQNMNPAHQYTLTFFGSHGYNSPPDADVLTVYNVYSDTNYTSLIASTNLAVGGSALGDWNVDRLAVIGPIYPSASGAMYIDFMGSGFGGGQGNRGFLNDMQIVDVTGGATPSDPFGSWQSNYFSNAELANPAYSGPNADPLGKGISNTNQFLAGFNPTNSTAYPHILSIAKSSSTNLAITYLGASGDSTYSPGFSSRTNVLEFTTNAVTGNYSSNNFVSTGQTNILSGGIGLGTVASFVQTNGVSTTPRYYRVRVLVP